MLFIYLYHGDLYFRPASIQTIDNIIVRIVMSRCFYWGCFLFFFQFLNGKVHYELYSEEWSATSPSKTKIELIQL